jgi:hypothetical protein
MSVPADSDAITPKWLTTVLREAGALDQARVTSIQSAPIGQLGFFGQIPRLRVSYDKLEPGAPQSLAAKFSAPKSTSTGDGPLHGVLRARDRLLSRAR